MLSEDFATWVWVIVFVGLLVLGAVGYLISWWRRRRATTIVTVDELARFSRGDLVVLGGELFRVNGIDPATGVMEVRRVR